jgi:hypothetical protein
MPRGDRTGPMGAGPMTGRAAGYCAGYDMPGYAGPGYAGPMPRGFGLGRGGGWGWRHWYDATRLPGWARFGRAPAWRYEPYAEPVTREQEVESLKARAGWLKEQLDAVNRCLGELEKKE